MTLFLTKPSIWSWSNPFSSSCYSARNCSQSMASSLYAKKCTITVEFSISLTSSLPKLPPGVISRTGLGGSSVSVTTWRTARSTTAPSSSSSFTPAPMSMRRVTCLITTSTMASTSTRLTWEFLMVINQHSPRLVYWFLLFLICVCECYVFDYISHRLVVI